MSLKTCLSLALALLLCVAPCEASLVVFLPTKDGLLVVADKRFRSMDKRDGGTDAVKIVSVNKNTVLAVTGIESLWTGPPGKRVRLFDSVKFLRRYLAEVSPIKDGDLDPQIPTIQKAGTEAFRFLMYRLKEVKDPPNVSANHGELFKYGIFHYDTIGKRYQTVIVNCRADQARDQFLTSYAKIPPITYCNCVMNSFGTNEMLIRLQNEYLRRKNTPDAIGQILICRDPVNACSASRGLEKCHKVIKFAHEKNPQDISDNIDAILLSPTGAKCIALNNRIAL